MKFHKYLHTCEMPNKHLHTFHTYLSPHCECSGTYELPVKRDFVKGKMEALHGVASFYGFSWLEEELGNYIDVAA